MRRNIKQSFGRRHKAAFILLIVGILATIGVVIYVVGTNLEKTEQQKLANQEPLPSVRDAQRQRLTYNDQEYWLKKNIDILLLIGVDKTDEDASSNKELLPFRNGGHADYLSLLVFDHTQKTLNRINIDRDTMTDIKFFSLLGEEKGNRKAQISLAHAYGQDDQQAAQLTVDAARNLLLGLEIKDYLAYSMDSINMMNELVGGVTLTIPEDLTSIDPAFQKGAQVTLQGNQANRFVRARMNVGDGTNETRMNRQNLFMTAFFERISHLLSNDVSFINSFLNKMSPYNTSSLSIGRLSNLVHRSRGYVAPPPLVLTGERRVNAMNNVEFIPNIHSIWQVVLEACFEPVPKD